MKIGQYTIDRHAPPFVIAEIGVNHDGDVQKALALVDAARAAGAQAVKVQVFRADLLMSRASRLADYQKRSGQSDPNEMLRRLELSFDDMAQIAERAHSYKLAAIATVFSIELVEQSAALAWDAWKVASPDIINRPLIDALAVTGKPLLLSTGAATIEEVRQAIEWIANREYIIMQCVSAYPTPDGSASLSGRIALEKASRFAFGYSDHTTNVLTGAMAVASGARVLEKHITHDRSANGPDHSASLDPGQFSEYVRLSRLAYDMLGENKKQVLDIEREVREVSRQSIVAAVELKAGATIQRKDIMIKRPGTGISPALLTDIVGRKLSRSIQADEPITQDALA